MSITRDGGAGPILAMDAATAARILEESKDHPHEGRVYDFYLGGSSNFAVDREFAKAQIRQWPLLPWLALQNRRFLGRMVRYLIRRGIRQFVDIGSGLPTEGNVHQITETVAPGEAHVAYIDHDPVAIAHAFMLLQDAYGSLERHVAIQAELANYRLLWKAVVDSGRIDPDKPIGLLFAAVLHFVPDDDLAAGALTYLRDQLAPGSYLGLSHATFDGMDEEQRAKLAAVADNYDNSTTARTRLRSREEILSYFGGWELVEPGLVWTPDWQPPGLGPDHVAGDIPSSEARILAAVARKP